MVLLSASRLLASTVRYASPIVVSAAVRDDCTGVLATTTSAAAPTAGIGIPRPACGSKKPVLRKIAFLVLSRSRFRVALGEAPVKLNMKSSCLLSWCGGMNVLAASAGCPLPDLPSTRQRFKLGMAIGAEVPSRV